MGREYYGITRKVRSILPRRSLIHGTFIPIMKIVNAFGIEEMLKKHLTESESMQIITVVV